MYCIKSLVNISTILFKTLFRLKMVELTFKDYKQSIIIEGNTMKWRGNIKAEGGTWNQTLKAWVFPQTKRSVIENLCKTINNGSVSQVEVETKTYEPRSTTSRTNTSSSSSTSSTTSSDDYISRGEVKKNYVSRDSYYSLVQRMERLEALLNHKDFVESNSKKKVVTIQKESSDDSEEEENPKRMMHSKK